MPLAKHRLAAIIPLSRSEKSRDMRLTSRTITSLLAAVGAGFAVSTMIGAPIAVAQVCDPAKGQSEINGECIYPDNKTHDVPGGEIQCTQHSCVYRED
jgi:hypothetical protein